VIAREGEELARAGCDVIDAAENCHDSSDRRERSGSRYGLGRIEHSLNVRLTCRGVENTIDVSKAETEGDEHEKAHGAVDNSRPDHCTWKSVRSVSQLLTHVRCSVRSEQREDWCKLANQAGKSNTAPAGVVLE